MSEFVDLLSNAVKYTRTREEVPIEVGAEDRSEEVALWVRDNGVGFDMKYVDKLFGVFQRRSTTAGQRPRKLHSYFNKYGRGFDSRRLHHQNQVKET